MDELFGGFYWFDGVWGIWVNVDFENVECVDSYGCCIVGIGRDCYFSGLCCIFMVVV